MRMFAWCGMNAARSSAVMPAASSACFADLRHLPDRPAEDGLAVLAHRRPRLLLVEVLLERRVHADRVPFRAVGSPDARRDAGLVGGADDRGARAVAEQERDRAVFGVHVLRQLLGADHEHVLRGAGADEGVGLGDRVGVAGAGGADVVGGRRVRADAVGQQRRHRRGHGDVADRRDEHRADLARRRCRRS